MRGLFGERLGRDVGVRLWDGTALVPAERLVHAERQHAVRAARRDHAAARPQSRQSVRRGLVRRRRAARGRGRRARTRRRLACRAWRWRGWPRWWRACRRRRATATTARARLDGPSPFESPRRGRRSASTTISRSSSTAAFWATISSIRARTGTRASTTLDEAQRAKLDYVLDKVRLRPGQSFLDIGCGWGSLVMRAAERGANALGITLSRRQHEEAQRRIAERGLGERARVELRDYRDLGRAPLRRDRLGRDGRARRGDSVWPNISAARTARCATAACSSTTASPSKAATASRGAPTATSSAATCFPTASCCRIDMYDARGRTGRFRSCATSRTCASTTPARCASWVENLAAHYQAAVDATDWRTERIWRIYMAGSARNFALGRMGLMQTLLAKTAARRRQRHTAYSPRPLRRPISTSLRAGTRSVCVPSKPSPPRRRSRPSQAGRPSRSRRRPITAPTPTGRSPSSRTCSPNRTDCASPSTVTRSITCAARRTTTSRRSCTPARTR